MDEVFAKTRELGEALLQSEIYKNMKAAEEKVQSALNNYVEARAVYNDLITKYGKDYVKKPLTYREFLNLLFNP